MDLDLTPSISSAPGRKIAPLIFKFLHGCGVSSASLKDVYIKRKLHGNNPNTDIDNVKLSDYKRVDTQETEDIYQRKGAGSPKYIAVTARGPAMEYDKKH